jgi:ubiquitin C-terminal hydrolase
MKGLPNIGNTCYFNATLQCLFHVPPLSNYFLSNESNENDFTREYCRLVRQYWSDDADMIDPTNLLECVRSRFKQFVGHDQQDSQEVLMCMFEMFNQTLVKHVFMGKSLQETICKSGRSHLQEEFYSIVASPSKDCSVEQALEERQNYSTIEEYVDAKGVKHNVSVSRTMFWEIPRIFIVSFQNRRRIKINQTISFTMHPNAPKNYTCTLFALILHQGSEHGGHYTSFTNHRGIWYYKDDLHVTTVEAPPEEGYYYMAFYK